MNKFGICNKCKGVNMNSLKNKLQEIDSDAEIEIRCQNLCGIGRIKPFVVANHIPIIADSEEELIKKVKKQLKIED